MPSAHAHLHEDDEIGPSDLSAEARPIVLADIDRVLGESAVLERTRGASPIRVWRADLTLALESLAYARAILAADVAILRHCLAAGRVRPAGRRRRPPRGHGRAALGRRSGRSPAGSDDEPELDLAVFDRSDRLIVGPRADGAHRPVLARGGRAALRELEAQLAELTERQNAVEVRLQQIRAAIVRQYQEGAVRDRGTGWAEPPEHRVSRQ